MAGISQGLREDGERGFPKRMAENGGGKRMAESSLINQCNKPV